MKMVKRLAAIVLALAMVLGLVACGKSGATAKKSDDQILAAGDEANTNKDQAPGEKQSAGKENGEPNAEGEVEEFERITQAQISPTPTGDYNKGVVLVKIKTVFDVALCGELEIVSAEPLYSGSKWYAVKLADTTKTEEAVTYLISLGTFDLVDYDYTAQTAAISTAPGVKRNPSVTTLSNPSDGGSADVVVAVIDSGVQINHPDLKNNIWVNPGEIPNNGRDDDGNGYVDDVNGWDFYNEDKDPSDDNDHGTHVAGIIAAEKNTNNVTGVAYNCKIMALKASNYKGEFYDSDIVAAINYAYKNGAHVINMSFGGYGGSAAIRDALNTAYKSCVLVAAAGNDGLCNHSGCSTHSGAAPAYPAAWPNVIAVMSTTADGKNQSYFSNFDHWSTDSVEYEVYAIGQDVYSTVPGSGYAYMDGTSMACPAVAGVAALLRSAFPPDAGYDPAFIRNIIVTAGTYSPDGRHYYVGIEEAFANAPSSEAVGYGYIIDDSPAIDPKNNGNGIIEEGEKVRIRIKPRFASK